MIVTNRDDYNNVTIIIPYCSCAQRNPEFSFQKHVPVIMPGYMETKWGLIWLSLLQLSLFSSMNTFVQKSCKVLSPGSQLQKNTLENFVQPFNLISDLENWHYCWIHSPFTFRWNLASDAPGATWISWSSSKIWGNCSSSVMDSSCSRLSSNWD